jgi:hypothetical protein
MNATRRYVLQLLIVGAAATLIGIALFAPPQPAYAFALGVFAFFAVVFYFTLLLREHTESRLNSSARQSAGTRVASSSFLAQGAVACLGHGHWFGRPALVSSSAQLRRLSVR